MNTATLASPTTPTPHTVLTTSTALTLTRWYRQDRRAQAHVRRCHRAYELAWRSGQPAYSEWVQLQSAHRRATFVVATLCRVRGW